MNYSYSPDRMQDLMNQHSEAKKQMTTGIVLTSVGFFLLYFGIVFLFFFFVGIIFIIPSIPLLIVGIIKLVNGIRGRVRANQDIKLMNKQRENINYNTNGGFQSNTVNNAYQPAAQQYQPAPQFQPNQNFQAPPQYQPNQNFQAPPQFQPNQNFQAPPQFQPNQNFQAPPQFQPNQNFQAPPQFQPNQNFQETPQYQPNQNYQTIPQYQNDNRYQAGPIKSFVDIDLNKYAPLECGVTLDPNKDYKFHRAEGFVGSVPQNFVNRTFPKCPLCCTKAPEWMISGEFQMSWKGNLYYFKCSGCNGVISMSVPDVTTLGNGVSGVAIHPNVGVANLIAKSSSGKEAGAVYAVIENVGTSGVSKICEGKEFKLEHMQDMFLRM